MKSITGIYLSFLKETNDKLENFNIQVQEHESYVEELYLEVLNKIKNPDEGGSILPKTPAPKGRPRGRKKRNTNDQNPATEGQSENGSNGASCETPPPTRFGRTASKAANAKIKESQRQLNDLSSKMRRPVEFAVDVTRSSARHSNNSDSGMDDRLSSWSTASSSKTSSSGKSVLLVPVQMKQQNPLPEDEELTPAEEKQQADDADSHPAAADIHPAQVSSVTPDRKRRGSSVPSKSLSKIRKTGESPKQTMYDLSPDSQGKNETSEAQADMGSRRLSRSLSSSKKPVRLSRSLQPANDSVLDIVDSSVPSPTSKNNNVHKEYSIETNVAIPSNANVDCSNADNLALGVKHQILPEANAQMITKDTEVAEPRACQGNGVISLSNKAEIAPEFKSPLSKTASPPAKRTTRTKTRQMINNTNSQQVAKDPEHETCGAVQTQAPDPNNQKRTRTKKRLAEAISQASDGDDIPCSDNTTNNKKRKIQETGSDKKLDQPVCYAVSGSENEEGVGRRKCRTSAASMASPSSTSSKRKCSLTSNQSKRSAESDECASENEVNSKFHSPVKQKKKLQLRAVVSVSPLSRSVLSTHEPQVQCEEQSSPAAADSTSDSTRGCPDVQHVSVHDISDDSVRVEEPSSSDDAGENEEEEPKEVIQPPRRMTRSKVRQHQQKLDEAEQLQQQLARAAADRQRLLSSRQPVKKDAGGVQSSGKFSPRPFSNRTGVKQLAAAYSEHVAAASPQPRLIGRASPSSGSRTPLASDRKRLQGRSSSTSRVFPSSSRITPLSVNRVRHNLASSSDAHHHRAKLGTPSQGSRPRNLVCGMKTFLGGSVQVQQAARPTKEQVEEQKQLELLKKREKEEETLRKKEEQMRTKRNETKRRNEERMRKVHEARLAAERKAAEAKETAEREKKLKEQRLKEETLRKKQLLIKKAEEEKRRRDEEQLRKEEEAKKRKEEAEEKRRALLEQQEEEKRRREEAKILEEERRAEERRLAIKREEERLAREKEELRLLKEREAARAAASSSKPPIMKPTPVQKTLNQTYDANSTYTVPANSTFTVPASSNTPKTPCSGNTKTSVSSQDSYDLTPAVRNEHDYGIDDLKSDDSSDDDMNPKKKIPKWATRDLMRNAILRQEFRPPNVDAIFPLQQVMPMLDLHKIFSGKKCSFKVRSSSAHWTTPPHKIFSQVS